MIECPGNEKVDMWEKVLNRGSPFSHTIYSEYDNWNHISVTIIN